MVLQIAVYMVISAAVLGWMLAVGWMANSGLNTVFGQSRANSSARAGARCPFCGEEVETAGQRCRFCGRYLG